MATMALSSAASALGSHALHARSPRRLARLPSGAPSGLRLVCNAERRTKFNGRPEEPGDLLLQSAPCPVPREQQPSQELLALQATATAPLASRVLQRASVRSWKPREGSGAPADRVVCLVTVQEAFLFDWPRMTLPEFSLRLAGVFAGFFVFIGLPISLVTFSAQDELLQVIAASTIGSGFITTLLVLRMYLGYSHVSSRLLSATVEYEETGWYDGQVWVKTPQMLMRDRLLGTYQVKPVLDTLKRTLLGLSGGMVAATLILALGPTPEAYSRDEYMRASYQPGDARQMAIQAAQRREYEARVAEWEAMGVRAEEVPSVTQDEDSVMSGSILDHMRSP